MRRVNVTVLIFYGMTDPRALGIVKNGHMRSPRT